MSALRRLAGNLQTVNRLGFIERQEGEFYLAADVDAQLRELEAKLGTWEDCSAQAATIDRLQRRIRELEDDAALERLP
jgi:polyhydroxyalkanoate synthesis regulator phasin